MGWALVSPDGVAPSQMVGVSAYVNLTLHHKVQKFSSGTGSPGWSWKKGCKTVACVCTNPLSFAFVVLGLVSSLLCQEIGWEERLQNYIFRFKWDVKPRSTRTPRNGWYI